MAPLLTPGEPIASCPRCRLPFVPPDPPGGRGWRRADFEHALTTHTETRLCQERIDSMRYGGAFVAYAPWSSSGGSHLQRAIAEAVRERLLTLAIGWLGGTRETVLREGRDPVPDSDLPGLLLLEGPTDRRLGLGGGKVGRMLWVRFGLMRVWAAALYREGDDPRDLPEWHRAMTDTPLNRLAQWPRVLRDRPTYTRFQTLVRLGGYGAGATYLDRLAWAP